MENNVIILDITTTLKERRQARMPNTRKIFIIEGWYYRQFRAAVTL